MTKYPAGFYILGIENRDDVVRRWSLQALRMLRPGEQWQFDSMLKHPTKSSSAHAWGLCRLLKVTVGMRVFEPIDGALFIDIDYIATPGYSIKVIVEALDFEPLSTIPGFQQEQSQ